MKIYKLKNQLGFQYIQSIGLWLCVFYTKPYKPKYIYNNPYRIYQNHDKSNNNPVQPYLRTKTQDS